MPNPAYKLLLLRALPDATHRLPRVRQPPNSGRVLRSCRALSRPVYRLLSRFLCSPHSRCRISGPPRKESPFSPFSLSPLTGTKIASLRSTLHYAVRAYGGGGGGELLSSSFVLFAAVHFARVHARLESREAAAVQQTHFSFNSDLTLLQIGIFVAGENLWVSNALSLP